MRRAWRKRFPRHWLQRKPLVSDPVMHHGTCVTHAPWCMSGSLTRGGGENVPGIPGACATRNFAYLVRGPCQSLPNSAKNGNLIQLFPVQAFNTSRPRQNGRPGDKPLSEPMMVRLPTHICVTRPQWVKLRSSPRVPHALAWGPSSSHTKKLSCWVSETETWEKCPIPC